MRGGGHPMPPSRRPPALAAAFPVLAAVAVYLPALRNGFVWDDPLVLGQLRAFESVGDLIVLPPSVPRFYYRPFIFLTYLIDRAIAGETPVWFHVSVIAWHALATFLVYLVGRQLFPRDWMIAAGGALLFAVAPVHVESVAWMAGRSDVIVGALLLAAVLVYRDRRQLWTAWLAGGVYLLAALSKEMAVCVVVLVPLLDLLETRRLHWGRYVPLLAATVAYFALRAASVGAVVGGLAPAAGQGALVLDVVRALGFYSVRALVPVGLCGYIPEVPDAPLYLVAGLTVPVLAIAGVAQAWRRGAWAPAFLVGWFFLTLAPSLMVILRRSASAVVADRYLYVPTVAVYLLLAWALVRLAERRRVALSWQGVAFAALAAVFAAQTVPYTRVWRDNLSFWSDVAAKVPGDAMPHRELGSALLSHGDLANAERAFLRALEGKSDADGRLMTYSNLGNLYRRQQRFDEAQQAFEAARQFGAHPALLHNLGMTLMVKIERDQSDPAAVQRDLVKARDAFREALALGNRPGALGSYLEWDPAKTHALLGQVLFAMGDRAGARTHLEAALRLQPSGGIADICRQYLRQLDQ